MANSNSDQKIAELFSGRLMRAQDVMHAITVLAEIVADKPGVHSGDRDLASLVGVVRIAQEDFERLMMEIESAA